MMEIVLENGMWLHIHMENHGLQEILLDVQ